MNDIKGWKDRVKAELAQAESARRDGNEGKARVCARRAAGIIIGEYMQRQGLPVPKPGAYDRLRQLSELPIVDAKIREVASHFLIRINPDHSLPVEADLIRDAHWLLQELLET